MPERASFKDCTTSPTSLPIGETIPMPVTTTRLILAHLMLWLSRPLCGFRKGIIERGVHSANHGPRRGRKRGLVHTRHFEPSSVAKRLETVQTVSGRFGVLEQADPHVARPVDDLAIGLHPAIGDSELELGAHDALEVDAIFQTLDVRRHLTGELHLADAERAPAAGFAQPAEEETGELPERVEAKATGHHRIAFEMAFEEPKIGAHVELGLDRTLAGLAAILQNFGDSIEHQHRF